MDIDEEQEPVKNKIVLHGAEYEKYKTAILHTVKFFESQGIQYLN